MNYGLWDENHDTLKDANMNLCNFVYECMNIKEGENILDVGCGYGEQDLYWNDKIKSLNSYIKAIDLSQGQIDRANSIRNDKKIENIDFMCMDAHHLCDYFPAESFNCIVSVESAFHYENRPRFFECAYKLLKPGGRFVITDIVLNNDFIPDIFNSILLGFAKEFLCIPDNNLIKASEWREHLTDAGFTIKESFDITDKTYKPYYTHFFQTYMKNNGYSEYFSDILTYIFISQQPFSYVVYVCHK
jgi:cyclopropane fatty-acyl-phospholipid synthase-like methyltransferase